MEERPRAAAHGFRQRSRAEVLSCRHAGRRGHAMIQLSFASDATPLRRVLCLGAHSDDIEIGCGGTILQLVESHPELEIRWVVLSGNERRAEEARCAASRF